MSSTRSHKADVAARLRNEGKTLVQTAEAMSISTSYVRQLLYDPSGEKERARKRSYSGVCADCGGRTSGKAGGNKKNHPTRCAHCACGHRRKVEAPAQPPVPQQLGPRRCRCGTVMSQYNEGDTCWPCANTAARVALERSASYGVTERRDAIVDALEKRHMTVAQLVEELHLVEKTAREDLLALIEAGRVERAEISGGFRHYAASVDAAALMDAA